MGKAPNPQSRRRDRPRPPGPVHRAGPGIPIAPGTLVSHSLSALETGHGIPVSRAGPASRGHTHAQVGAGDNPWAGSARARTVCHLGPRRSRTNGKGRCKTGGRGWGGEGVASRPRYRHRTEDRQPGPSAQATTRNGSSTWNSAPSPAFLAPRRDTKYSRPASSGTAARAFST